MRRDEKREVLDALREGATRLAAGADRAFSECDIHESRDECEDPPAPSPTPTAANRLRIVSLDLARKARLQVRETG